MSTLGFKPESCKSCTFFQKGYGFFTEPKVPQAKIAVLWEQPSENAIIYGDSAASRSEDGWLYHNVVKQGFNKNDVAIFHLRRCFASSKVVVSEREKKIAADICRQWDHSLREWSPNVFMITYELGKHFDAPTLTQIIRRHVEHAFGMALKGFRPMLLCGEAASRLLAPHLIDNGGIKNWHGHWFEGEWPFVPSGRNEITPIKPTLILPKTLKESKEEQLGLFS